MPAKLPKGRKQIAVGPFTAGMAFAGKDMSVQKPLNSAAFLYNCIVSPEGLVNRPGFWTVAAKRATTPANDVYRLVDIGGGGAVIKLLFNIVDGDDVKVVGQTWDPSGGFCYIFRTLDPGIDGSDNATTFEATPFNLNKSGLSTHLTGLHYNSGNWYAVMNNLTDTSFGNLGGWRGAGSYLNPLNTPWVDAPTIPLGKFSFTFKDRLWVVAASRVYFSEVNNFENFTAPAGGFFDVESTSGDVITTYEIINDNIYLFKREKTFIFTYLTDPNTDATLRVLQDQAGALDSIKDGLGNVYVCNRQGIFRFVNNTFYRIDQALNVRWPDDSTLVLNMLGDNLIFYAAASTYDAIAYTTEDSYSPDAYCYNTLTGAWTCWGVSTNDVSSGETSHFELFQTKIFRTYSANHEKASYLGVSSYYQNLVAIQHGAAYAVNSVNWRSIDILDHQTGLTIPSVTNTEAYSIATPLIIIRTNYIDLGQPSQIKRIHNIKELMTHDISDVDDPTNFWNADKLNQIEINLRIDQTNPFVYNQSSMKQSGSGVDAPLTRGGRAHDGTNAGDDFADILHKYTDTAHLKSGRCQSFSIELFKPQGCWWNAEFKTFDSSASSEFNFDKFLVDISGHRDIFN